MNVHLVNVNLTRWDFSDLGAETGCSFTEHLCPHRRWDEMLEEEPRRLEEIRAGAKHSRYVQTVCMSSMVG